MKKIASLFLILTLFYNVLGVYMMVAEQQEQSWVNAMEKTDDSNFELIEVEINPYAYVVDSGIEYANEDVVIKNKVYHVFKKRITNNVLKLYCLKNSHKEVLNKDLKRIVDNQLFDSNTNKENPTKKVVKSFIKDYISTDSVSFITAIESTSLLSLNNLFYPQKKLLSGYHTTNYPPPDMV
jgi:hypothetical protein